QSRPYLWNAVSSRTRRRANTCKRFPIDKNWRKRSRREFARGILWLRRARREWQRQIVFRCNRISIRPRQVTPIVHGPAIHGKKGPEAAQQKRKAHTKP